MIDRRQFLASAVSLGALLRPRLGHPTGRFSETGLSPPRYRVRVERTFLGMRDGARLAATLYFPSGAPAGEKFPSLLELLPYRKDDGTVGRDHHVYSYFASRGYVGARVDVRGTGASDGVAEDEYARVEQEDALEVIAWLAGQSWSNGRVGMWGASYGGFNCIQVAMLRPSALAAIVPIYATDDRYTDDVHYYGGALHAFENIWAVGMEAENAVPAYPDYSLEDPRTRLRFEATPWMFRWLREQTDGPYWRHGSLRPDYDSIQAPTLMIGGWLDGYTNSIPRMLERMKAPTKAIIGPWPHTRPDSAHPGPRIDYLREVLRWWDYWLKGLPTGIMDEPRLAIYVQHYYPPSHIRLVDLEEIPGEWRFEEGWPIERVKPQEFFAHPGGKLSSRPPFSGRETLHYRPTAGGSAKTWAPDSDGSLGVDQRADDSFALTYTSDPLEEDLEILGFPKALLFVSSTAEIANWIVRVNDVAPDGSSHFVSRGVLNGTHRESHTDPRPLEPGRIYPLEIELQVTCWVFPRGHRFRLVVTNAEWPIVWPSPDPMATTLHLGPDHLTRLILPVCPPAERPRPVFQPPPVREPSPVESSGEPVEWRLERNEQKQTVSLLYSDDGTTDLKEEGVRIRRRREIALTASDREPARASLEGQALFSVDGRGERLNSEADISLTSDRTHFHLEIRRRLGRGGKTAMEKTWRESVPRRLV